MVKILESRIHLPSRNICCKIHFNPSTLPTMSKRESSEPEKKKMKKPLHKNEESSTTISFLQSYLTCKIVYPPRRISCYAPSCLMMDYIVHHINRAVCENFQFKRENPSYHPYLLRLYFGIQCLRAGDDVGELNDSQHWFLNKFLSRHALETLPIPGILLDLFKTLCSSQPEIRPNYGKVFPILPSRPGPKTRKLFIANNVAMFFLPNIPGIFALIEHLHAFTAMSPPAYPTIGKHVPVRDTAVVFGHHSFGAHADRTALEKWSLCSPGLQYPCEADRDLNRNFAEQYANFGFPVTAQDDNISKTSSFLGLSQSMAWFDSVKEVACAVASLFEYSGTLADCAATESSGFSATANQIVCNITDPRTPPTAPTRIADPASQFPFSYRLSTTVRKPSPYAGTAAAFAQTHIRMFPSHPFLNQFGVKNADTGPFWEIRPIEKSNIDDSAYMTIHSIVRRSMK